MRPDLDDLDQEIVHVRREKEAAIDRQDFEAAVALRDKEKQLLIARAPA
jgi:ATP-dependent Clp protease ATP-binding subunit ClpC